jgi:hypothetical protein
VAVTETRRAGPRTANLAAVLRALRTGPLSRTQPAGRCGIAKSAVPGLLTELAERGPVRPAGLKAPLRGAAFLAAERLFANPALAEEATA